MNRAKSTFRSRKPKKPAFLKQIDLQREIVDRIDTVLNNIELRLDLADHALALWEYTSGHERKGVCVEKLPKRELRRGNKIFNGFKLAVLKVLMHDDEMKTQKRKLAKKVLRGKKR